MSFQPLAPEPTLRFSHGVEYVTPSPIVEIEVAATDSLGVLLGTPQLASVMVDTGSDYTILDERMAPLLGIDLAKCLPATLDVVGGGEAHGKAADVLVALCGVWVGARAIFQRKPKPPLLGRHGIFDRFAFAFIHRESRMLARPLPPP